MKTAIRTRINQEIKFLYIKKQQLNTQLYQTRLKCANYWNYTWAYIQENIERKLQHEDQYDKATARDRTDTLQHCMNQMVA
jgi:hypothetical protein